MSYRILIVEDDVTLQETLEYNLLNQGYDVSKVDDGYAAIGSGHETGNPDLILLDLMLPGIDGFEVCRILRRELNVPILMLTARTEEVDKIVGLEVGADDYLTKPFSMRELVARVKALLRRVELVREDVAASNRRRAGRNGDPRQYDSARPDLRELAIDESRREDAAGRQTVAHETQRV